MLLSGKMAKTSTLLRETTKIPSHSVEAMMTRTRGPKKVKKQALQLEVRGFGRSPTRGIINMGSNKHLQTNLEHPYKREV